MPDPKVMVFAGVVMVIAAKGNEITVVQLQVGPAEGNTIVKGEYVMNLNIHLPSTVGLAADATRLPRLMQPREALSLMRGPMTRNEIRRAREWRDSLEGIKRGPIEPESLTRAVAAAQQPPYPFTGSLM